MKSEYILDYNIFVELIPFMDINCLETLIKATKGTKDELLIKSYLRDKKIDKILEN